MKRTLIAALFGLVTLPALVMAFGPGPMGQGPENRPDPIEVLTDVLELRDDQVEPVQQILDSHHETQRACQESGREKLMQELSAVLDPTQLERFDAFTQAVRMGGRGPRSRPQRQGAYR